MKEVPAITCQVCGAPISAGSDFCPVCALRGALTGDDATSELARELTGSSPELQFGHYKVLTRENGEPFELGRGAMGVTYKAVDLDLQRPVSLKIIAERYLGDEPTRLRFVREARAAASVRHPNVASVFHLGKSGEIYFYAMEFAEGETLESLIRRSGVLDVKLALEVTTQVAAGLNAINKQNLVHRDIKPSNVMVSFDPDGRPVIKIIDLGLAKPLIQSPSDAAISLPGAFAGTPEFASPEQFTGIGVDIRSDLYSLGATLWQMLTGQPPFRGDLDEVMHQHQQAPLPLEQLCQVPHQAVVLLEVLLKKNPARRFQTPAELLAILPTVKDAIESGRQIVKTIRVFVSSQSDVQKERNLADRVIRSIAAELDLLVGDSDTNFQRLAEVEVERDSHAAETGEQHQLMFCPRFSELLGSSQGESYRPKGPDTSEFDLTVSIIWTRLGDPPPRLKMPDGTAPDSGMEYEIAWALDHASKSGGVPVLRVYRNCSKPVPPLEPKEQREAFGREWDAVQEFFKCWESDPGKLKGKVDNYRSLEDFEALFREQFRDFLVNRLEEELGHKISNRKALRWKATPFRGLNVFDFEHAPIFYGRTRAVGEVLDALEQQLRAQRPFVLIVGASELRKKLVSTSGSASVANSTRDD